MTQGPLHRTQRVVAAVVRRGDTFLVCRRAAHKRHGGLWEFPGGKVGPNESDANAVGRELREELGVTLVTAHSAEFEIADPDSPFLIAFVPVVIQDEPACHEHSELRWVTAAALLDLTLAPGDARYVEWLQQHRTRRDVA
ncbi:MAG: NUDIX domain-containing protein [Gemmatimonadaceae bacterium]